MVVCFLYLKGQFEIRENHIFKLRSDKKDKQHQVMLDKGN